MIKLLDLITEKFEIPSDLQKQLENTAYSALGYILTPHIEKFKKLLFANKELNDKCFKQLKNVFDTVKKFTEGSGNNTKITFTDVLVPEYFATTEAKQMIKKTDITIEKSGDDIWLSSKGEKTNNTFPHFYISKDPAGWDMKYYNALWEAYQNSYDNMLTDFDDKLVLNENILNKLKNWQSLEKPKKPKIHPDGQKMALVYEKQISFGSRYDHYFRVLPSRKVDTYNTPDYFQSATRPYIVQTIYLDQFDPDTISMDYFMGHVNNFIETSQHEGRHLLQHYGNKRAGFDTDYYGGPKDILRYNRNPELRGTDPGGKVSPTATNKDPNDKGGRVLHPFRDVEFKTNLYTYKQEIEKVLNQNASKKDWQQAFRNLLLYTTKKIGYEQFRKLFPYNFMWEYSVAKKHLEQLYNKDRPKFNEMVRELYKLIF